MSTTLAKLRAEFLAEMADVPAPARRFYIDTQLAARLSIPLDEIPFAMRRGDLPIPTAHTIHGAPLWDAATIDAMLAGGGE